MSESIRVRHSSINQMFTFCWNRRLNSQCSSACFAQDECSYVAPNPSFPCIFTCVAQQEPRTVCVAGCVGLEFRMAAKGVLIGNEGFVYISSVSGPGCSECLSSRVLTKDCAKFSPGRSLPNSDIHVCEPCKIAGGWRVTTRSLVVQPVHGYLRQEPSAKTPWHGSFYSSHSCVFRRRLD